MNSQLDSVINSAIEDKKSIVGCSVMVSQKKSVIYAKSVGLADREGKKAISSDSIYRLSSLSKPFTHVLTATLIDSGLLSFDEPVTRWLPYFTPQLADGSRPHITLRHLLSHTAGLSYGFLEPKEGGEYQRLGISDGMDISTLSLEENVRRIAQAQLRYLPGSSQKYSIATDVLGAVIESATEMTLAEAMQEFVNKPLGIRSATFSLSTDEQLVVPYLNDQPEPRLIGEGERISFDPTLYGVRYSPKRILDSSQFCSGGCGMAATATDMMKLLQCLLQRGCPLFSEEIMSQLLIDYSKGNSSLPGWGMASSWQVLNDPLLARSVQSKNTIAWGDIYGHYWMIDFEKELIVLILTNTAFEGINGKLTQDIIQSAYQLIN